MNMMRVAAFLTVLTLLLSSCVSVHAGEATGGEDVNPGDDVPFSVLERTTPSQDLHAWTLSVELDQAALDNGTTANFARAPSTRASVDHHSAELQ